MKKGEWNVVFLLDENPPSKIVFLKRAEDKAFGGGWYTGVGGKHEPGETKQQAAERELLEETGLKTPITHFATVVVDDFWYLYYFWGILKGKLPECNEGELEWLNLDKISNKNILRTTEKMVEEWRKRDFRVDKSWTIYTEKINTGEVNGLEKVIKRKEGLDE